MKALRRLYIKLRNNRILYPEKVASIFSFLQESQYWDRDTLEAHQVKYFNELVKLSKNTAYYKNRFQPISKVEDIKTLPITSKTVYQKNADDFFTGSIDKAFPHASSGSTGKPTKIFLSARTEAYRRASVMRFRDWWGLKPEDKLINFTAFPRNPKSILSKIKYFFNPKLDIDIFSVKEENIDSLFAKIKKYNPKYFRGYPSVIKSFALLLKEKKYDAKSLNLKVIIATSEILYDADKLLIEEVFNCKVANEYGCAEGGLIAYQCPEGGIHVQEDSILFYTNEKNEIVSTELFNDLSPLINYKIGDKVIVSDKECTCGRNLKLIDRIEGRTADNITGSDGSTVSFFFFDKMIKDLSETTMWGKIKRFQVVQKELDFNVYIVKGEDYTEDVDKYIVDYIKGGVSDTVKVDIIFVDDIKPEKSGKYKIFKRID